MRVSSKIVEMFQLSVSNTLEPPEADTQLSGFSFRGGGVLPTMVARGPAVHVQYIMQSEAHIGRLWMDSGDDLPRLIFCRFFCGEIVDLYKKLTTSGW
jgi:hypothetical protein